MANKSNRATALGSHDAAPCLETPRFEWIGQVKDVLGARAQAPMESGNILKKEVSHVTASSAMKWTAEMPSICLASVDKAILLQRDDVLLEIFPVRNWQRLIG
jgi:hypothetical protein